MTILLDKDLTKINDTEDTIDLLRDVTAISRLDYLKRGYISIYFRFMLFNIRVSARILNYIAKKLHRRDQ